MNATQYLAQFGVTVEQARSFIMANMATPINIYNAALQYKIDSKMLAEIVAPNFPGVTSTGVENFFNSVGLKGMELNPLEIESNDGAVLWQGLNELSPLYTFNNNTDILSTASLRSSVSSKVGTTTYNRIFDVKLLPGAADGVLDTTDLGFTHLGEIKATTANYESLFYGTLINAARNISKSEIIALNAFVNANAAALDADDRSLMPQIKTIISDMVRDPVTAEDPAYLTDTDIAMGLKDLLLEEVSFLGTVNQQNLFVHIIFL
jgi:hypothetical protein